MESNLLRKAIIALAASVTMSERPSLSLALPPATHRQQLLLNFPSLETLDQK